MSVKPASRGLRNKVFVVAGSSPVPEVELDAGLAHLRSLGFTVDLHPTTLARSFLFAGSDEARAAAIYDAAASADHDIVWTARGGYGMQRLLPLLDQLTAERGIPPVKLLIGYSDVTPLLEYVRTRWNWPALHAVMPSAGNFPKLDAAVWSATAESARGKPTHFAWQDSTLRWISDAPAADITGTLLGGNLSLWSSMVGTPYAADPRGKILFFEDIGEQIYRVDRMVVQLDQAAAFDGTAAIVLGDFNDCGDEDNTCRLNADPNDNRRQSLRRTYTTAEGLAEIFGPIGKRRGIPIATGLPVGHGPNFHPLPIGGEYRMTPSGKLTLEKWLGFV